MALGWLNNKKNQTTRFRSNKQESKIAKELNGRTTINSGATFGENDVLTDYAEIEAKTTAASSFSFKVADWKKLVKKGDKSKIPLFLIQFERNNLTLAVIPYEDLKWLIEQANT
jgi:hypothetical protein